MTNQGQPTQQQQLEAILQNPAQFYELKVQAKLFKKHKMNLENIKCDINEIETAIENDGWHPEFEERSYNLMTKMAKLSQRNPELKDTLDAMMDQIYMTTKKFKHASQSYERAEKVIGYGAMKKVNAIIPSPFKPQKTGLVKVTQTLDGMINLPESVENIEASLGQYKKQAKQNTQYLTGLMVFAMILGTMAAYYIGNISVTGFYIYNIEQTSKGLFVALLGLVIFGLVVLRRMKIIKS